MTSTTFFFIFIPILAFILLLVNLLLAPHNPYQEKDSVFECGFHSFLGQNRTQFSVSFFMFGLIFLLFDLEILLIYPFGVSGYTNDIYGLTIMIIFFTLLTVGFIFELGKNALSIDSKQISLFSYQDSPTAHIFLGLQSKSPLSLTNIMLILLLVGYSRLFYIITKNNLDHSCFSIGLAILLSLTIMLSLKICVCYMYNKKFELTKFTKFVIFIKTILFLYCIAITLLNLDTSTLLYVYNKLKFLVPIAIIYEIIPYLNRGVYTMNSQPTGTGGANTPIGENAPVGGNAPVSGELDSLMSRIDALLKKSKELFNEHDLDVVNREEDNMFNIMHNYEIMKQENKQGVLKSRAKLLEFFEINKQDKSLLSVKNDLNTKVKNLETLEDTQGVSIKKFWDINKYNNEKEWDAHKKIITVCEKDTAIKKVLKKNPDLNKDYMYDLNVFKAHVNKYHPSHKEYVDEQIGKSEKIVALVEKLDENNRRKYSKPLVGVFKQ
jgi:NADH-ubiquinone oxidoreductase chain 3